MLQPKKKPQLMWFQLMIKVAFILLFCANICLANEQIKQIEASLNNIKTMEAKILQIDSKNDNANGLFYLSKPGKMRIEYKTKKSDIVMVASKQMITYYDKELDEVSHVPTSTTPATILMQEKINFDDFEILSFDVDGNIYKIKFYQKGKKDEGIFVFTFKHDDTFILQRIDRFENENTTYRISILFTNIKINQEIPDKLFILKDKRLFN